MGILMPLSSGPVRRLARMTWHHRLLSWQTDATAKAAIVCISGGGVYSGWLTKYETKAAKPQ